MLLSITVAVELGRTSHPRKDKGENSNSGNKSECVWFGQCIISRLAELREAQLHATVPNCTLVRPRARRVLTEAGRVT